MLNRSKLDPGSALSSTWMANVQLPPPASLHDPLMSAVEAVVRIESTEPVNEMPPAREKLSLPFATVVLTWALTLNWFLAPPSMYQPPPVTDVVSLGAAMKTVTVAVSLPPFPSPIVYWKVSEPVKPDAGV